MNPFTPKTPFVILLAAGIFPFSTPALAGNAPATPTVAVSKPGTQATPAVSSRPKAGKNADPSPILRKPAVKKKNVLIPGPLGLYDSPEFTTPLLDYDKLNADLYPILSIRPHRPTADEKFWGTVAGVAGYSIAGVAAAQALGILPDDRVQKNK